MGARPRPTSEGLKLGHCPQECDRARPRPTSEGIETRLAEMLCLACASG